MMKKTGVSKLHMGGKKYQLVGIQFVKIGKRPDQPPAPSDPWGSCVGDAEGKGHGDVEVVGGSVSSAGEIAGRVGLRTFLSGGGKPVGDGGFRVIRPGQWLGYINIGNFRNDKADNIRSCLCFGDANYIMNMEILNINFTNHLPSVQIMLDPCR